MNMRRSRISQRWLGAFHRTPIHSVPIYQEWTRPDRGPTLMGPVWGERPLAAPISSQYTTFCSTSGVIYRSKKFHFAPTLCDDAREAEKIYSRRLTTQFFENEQKIGPDDLSPRALCQMMMMPFLMRLVFCPPYANCSQWQSYQLHSGT